MTIITRCAWVSDDPLYIDYHDDEWGRPVRDAPKLYEALMLEAFQAGLSWITILRKRENFRAAFDNFDPMIVAQYDEAKIDALLGDAGIIRHRGKIVATIAGAQAFLEIEAAQGFANYIWSFVDNSPIINTPDDLSQVPAKTDIAERLSKDLKKRGFKFVGPTITYAFMQAVGMVNDHVNNCAFKYPK